MIKIGFLLIILGLGIPIAFSADKPACEGLTMIKGRQGNVVQVDFKQASPKGYEEMPPEHLAQISSTLMKTIEAREEAQRFMQEIQTKEGKQKFFGPNFVLMAETGQYLKSWGKVTQYTAAKEYMFRAIFYAIKKYKEFHKDRKTMEEMQDDIDYFISQSGKIFRRPFATKMVGELLKHVKDPIIRDEVLFHAMANASSYPQAVAIFKLRLKFARDLSPKTLEFYVGDLALRHNKEHHSLLSWEEFIVAFLRGQRVRAQEEALIALRPVIFTTRQASLVYYIKKLGEKSPIAARLYMEWQKYQNIHPYR